MQCCIAVTVATVYQQRLRSYAKLQLNYVGLAYSLEVLLHQPLVDCGVGWQCLAGGVSYKVDTFAGATLTELANIFS